MALPPRRACLVALLGATAAVAAPLTAQDTPEPVCAQGVITDVEIHNGSVFPVQDDDPTLLRWGFGLANLLHVNTARSFIRDELIFAEGDCYDPFVVSESRRLLEEYGFIDQVGIDVLDDEGGGRRVVVRTRDRWSTQVDLGLAYDEGLHVERFQASEINFLGRGINAEVTHHERRETRDRSLRLFTPRFFGRTDADFRIGETRAGSFFYQRFNRGFVGETSRFSASESVEDHTGFYAYATGQADVTHVLLPQRRRSVELAGAWRFGDPGRSWVVGGSLQRILHRVNGASEIVQRDDFDDSTPGAIDLPDALARQAGDRGATRLALHVGTRRFRYEEYLGLDAITDRQVIALGFFGGVSVGRSLGLFVPDGVADADDTYARAYATATLPAGRSLVGFSASMEAAHADGAWRDVLAQADVFGWGRAGWLPGQTIFARASAGGGGRTTIPFQLSLGGREGVRSLNADALPGGRRLVFTLEDRIRLPWPRWHAVEFGATLFADAGRVWAGDAPFGADSEWMGAAGFGLRLAFPAGSRLVYRPEIVFPVGFDGSPIFRVTFEMNRIRYGFRTPRWGDSRRFGRGAEAF